MSDAPETIELATLGDLRRFEVDTIIDVRSPAEYAEDHLPGAINLPVLDDAERARVGTIYKQQSPFLARKVGAALIFRNAARHVETALAEKDGRWRPLIYCWRGGQRSGSFAWMLREIGWRTLTLRGGYRSFRRLVAATLYDRALPYRLIKIDGYTGTAKTELLGLLAARGIQTVDLEGLAAHRGSVLGGRETPQPSQKAFETALAGALDGFDPARPVVVEAESSKIGQLNLPPSLWSAMIAAPSLLVESPLDARAAYLARAYADVLADGAALREKLAPLRRHRGHAVVDRWEALIAEGTLRDLCAALAAEHYDPAYERGARARETRILARVNAGDLGPDALETAAAQIAEVVHSSTI